mgnify:CR=1 FL=1
MKNIEYVLKKLTCGEKKDTDRKQQRNKEK